MSPGLTAAGRPLPRASLLTAPFWEAAARRVLVRPVCHACRRSFFTPQAVCTHCLSRDWSYEPSAGTGEVYSDTVVHRPPLPGMAVPFHLAIVDLDEGWQMLANLDAGTAAPVPIGTRVHVGWLVLADGILLPCFVPDADGLVEAA